MRPGKILLNACKWKWVWVHPIMGHRGDGVHSTVPSSFLQTWTMT